MQILRFDVPVKFWHCEDDPVVSIEITPAVEEVFNWIKKYDK